MSWWLLAILYGPAGFGYIIVATYLPLMAKDAGSPLLTAHLWTLVGLSIVPVALAGYGSKTLGVLPCLTANLLVQAICVLLTRQRLASCLSSAVLVLAVPLWARHLW